MKRSTTIFIYLAIGMCSLLCVGELRAQQLTVFPGDANNNGVVNNVDVLYLGMAHGFIGPARDSMFGNFSFEPVSAQAWPFTFDNGVNYAHADCDGDGYIHYLHDLLPVLFNYHQTNPISSEPETYNPGIPGIDPPIFFDTTGLPAALNGTQIISLPIVLGTEDQPVDDLYGIAFSIITDGEFAPATEVELDLSDPSWANTDGDNFYMYVPIDENRIDVAWTRTDQNMKSGFGPIGRADFIIIIDVISLQQNITMRIDSVKLFDKYGNETSVAGDTMTIVAVPDALSSGPKKPEVFQGKIYPNPCSDVLNIKHSDPLDEIILYSNLGETALYYQAGKSNQAQIPVGQLASGVYKLIIHSKNQVYTETILIE